jgi:hypothetical protein
MILEQKITQRRITISQNWQAFLSQRSPYLVADVIERSKTKLPDDFVPWAPGVVVASDYLLRAASYRPGSGCPEAWYPAAEPGVFTKAMHRNRLKVHPCGEFWRIERAECEVLAYSFGSLPVVTRTAEAAMRLGEFCHPRPLEGENCHPCPRGLASCLRWVMSAPNGIFWC